MWRDRVAGRRAASLLEHGLLVSLIALVAVGAITAFGDTGDELFSDAGNVLFPGEGGPAALWVAASPGLVAEAASGEISWGSRRVAGVSAVYSLASGVCLDRTALGDGPHDLPWSGAAGRETLAWSTGLAGCTANYCLTAAEDGLVRCAALEFSPYDMTADPILGLAPLDGQNRAVTVLSDAVVLSGFTGPLPLIVSSAAVGAGFHLDGVHHLAGDGAVTATPGSELILELTTAEGWSELSEIRVEIGGEMAVWRVTTAAAPICADTIVSWPAAGQCSASLSASVEGTNLAAVDDSTDLTGADDFAGSANYVCDLGVWRIQLEAICEDVVPNPISNIFYDIIGFGDPNSAATTASVLLAGFSGTLPLRLERSTSDSGYQFKLNDGPWTSFTSDVMTKTVSPGTILQLGMTRGAAGVERSILVSIGGRWDRWVTRPKS